MYWSNSQEKDQQNRKPWKRPWHLSEYSILHNEKEHLKLKDIKGFFNNLIRKTGYGEPGGGGINQVRALPHALQQDIFLMNQS